MSKQHVDRYMYDDMDNTELEYTLLRRYSVFMQNDM